jgi:NADH:ubiquinone reductase (H+-translocating)
VVIIGAGFGGLAAARTLRSVPVEITLIDRRNFHLFQPLLYQVATAALSPGDIAWPLRSIFASQKNVRVVMMEVNSIDPASKTVADGGGLGAFCSWSQNNRRCTGSSRAASVRMRVGGAKR